MILDRLAEDLGELAIVEQRPIQDGRNMTMMLGPSKAILAGTLGEDGEAPAVADNGELPAAAENGETAPQAAAPAEPEAPPADDAA
jgi:translation initiation factor IF-3